MQSCGVIRHRVRDQDRMPLEQAQPDGLLPIAERHQAGQRLRKLVPRRQHAAWAPQADRRDPLEILVETSRHRI